jgi:hypothetical protein
VVTDATGAVVPNAKVVITQIETGLQTSLVTNPAGFYSAPALRPGTYSVSVAAAGFRAETRAGIELRVQERLSIDFRLEVGATASEITITAAAPLLESETSSLGQVIEQRTITHFAAERAQLYSARHARRWGAAIHAHGRAR